jgi:hypothetical protein
MDQIEKMKRILKDADEKKEIQIKDYLQELTKKAKSYGFGIGEMREKPVFDWKTIKMISPPVYDHFKL